MVYFGTPSIDDVLGLKKNQVDFDNSLVHFSTLATVFPILGNGHSFEEAAINALTHVGYYAQCHHETWEVLDKVVNKNFCEMGRERDFIYGQIEINRDFCVKEMGISSAQLEEEGSCHWNSLVQDEDGKWHLCTY